MAQLSAVTKTAIITKALERGKTPLKEIASANNVGLSTLTRWINSYKQGDVPTETKLQKASSDIIPAQKLHQSVPVILFKAMLWAPIAVNMAFIVMNYTSGNLNF